MERTEITPEFKEKMLKELDSMAKQGFALTAMFARGFLKSVEDERATLSASQDECRRLRGYYRDYLRLARDLAHLKSDTKGSGAINLVELDRLKLVGMAILENASLAPTADAEGKE